VVILPSAGFSKNVCNLQGFQLNGKLIQLLPEPNRIWPPGYIREQFGYGGREFQ